MLFAFSPDILRLVRARRGQPQSFRLGVGGLAAMLLCSVYGGYFGAGIGILMLAGLALCGLDEVALATALKNAMAFLINGVACIVFILQGAVVWPATLWMMAGAVAGGFLGALLARRLPIRVFRASVIAIGSLLTVFYFFKAFIA